MITAVPCTSFQEAEFSKHFSVFDAVARVLWLKTKRIFTLLSTSPKSPVILVLILDYNMAWRLEMNWAGRKTSVVFVIDRPLSRHQFHVVLPISYFLVNTWPSSTKGLRSGFSIVSLIKTKYVSSFSKDRLLVDRKILLNGNIYFA